MSKTPFKTAYSKRNFLDTFEIHVCFMHRSQCMPGLVCSVDDCSTFDHLLRERFPNDNDLLFSGSDDCCVLPRERANEWIEWLEREGEEEEDRGMRRRG